MKDLGATHAFDYRDSDVLEQIGKVLKPGDAVVDCIGSEDTQNACGKILGRIGGGKLPVLLWLTGQFPENVKAVQGSRGYRATLDALMLMRLDSQRPSPRPDQPGSWRCSLAEIPPKSARFRTSTGEARSIHYRGRS